MDRRIEFVAARQRDRRSPYVLYRVMAVLLIAIIPLSMVAAGSSVLPGDVVVTEIVQTQLPGWLAPLIVVANILGEAPVMIGIAFVLAAWMLTQGHRGTALLVAASTFGQVANLALKYLLESPRPSETLVRVTEQANGFGFPSGHVMGTTVFVGVLLYVVGAHVSSAVRLRVLQTGLLALPLLMGIARVDTGAHWPSDVLGAWIWGTLATLALIVAAHHFALRPLPVPRTIASHPYIIGNAGQRGPR